MKVMNAASLRDSRGDFADNLAENIIDAVRHMAHAYSCTKSDQRHNHGILDQILAIIVEHDLNSGL
jgi:hypothetical protein